MLVAVLPGNRTGCAYVCVSIYYLLSKEGGREVCEKELAHTVMEGDRSQTAVSKVVTQESQ